MYKVTIVIPNFNGEAYLKGCLDSLEKQTEKHFEWIIIDDCSTDQSVNLIRHYPEVRLFINQKNSGFAYSVNRGIKLASAPYVLLLNNDVEVANDFVEQLYKRIHQNAKIFSVSSQMIRFKERDKLDDTGDFYHILGWAYKRGDGKSITTNQKASAVFSTCAGAGIYRRAIFDEIGYFDEAYFAYLEDVDVSYRGLIYGYKNVYEPKAICYHIGSATTAQGEKYSPFKVKLSARNNVYTAYKNMPFLQLVVNSPFLVCGFAIKGLIFKKRGYGKAYGDGLKEGLTTLHRVNKTKFKLKHTLNYLKIEGMLFQNLARHINEKVQNKI